MTDASPFLHTERVGRNAQEAAYELIRFRTKKPSYEEEQRRRRDPKFKKRGGK